MTKTKVYLGAELRNFATTPNGVQWEAVIFSSEYNRNNAFFDINKIKKWQNKLEKVLLNNDHNGKYFANSTDKITSLEVKTDETGITEVFAVVQSTNPEKINNPESVTGFSIELSVKNSDVIANENGEYYIDFEWVGLAYLLGIAAGSGDTRILKTKTFAEQQPPKPQIMNETQITEKFSQFKTELKAEFAEEMKGKIATKTTGSMSWVGEDGKMYTETWESFYQSITTAFEPDAEEPALFALLAKKFGYSKQEAATETETKTDGETAGDTTPPEDPELTKTEMQLNKNAEMQAKMATFRSDEKLVEHATTSTADAKETSKINFLSKFRK